MATFKAETLFILLIAMITRVLSFNAEIKSPLMHPFTCSKSDQILTCSSYLYHISKGHSLNQIASFYSVNESQIKPITRGIKQDYKINVPCTCKDEYGTTKYIYDTLYKVQDGDIINNVSEEFYSGQALINIEEEDNFVAGNMVNIHLVCGCVEKKTREVVTYTVQEDDTLYSIAELLSAKVSEIENLNTMLTHDPSYIDVGWVLFVPTEKTGYQQPKKRKVHNWTIITCVISGVILLSVGTLIFFFCRRKQIQEERVKDPTTVTRYGSLQRNTLQNHFLKRDIEDVTKMEQEKPVVFNLEEVEEATNNFEESRKIGEGGYGSVYFGVLRGWEVAIKKMKATKTKEFFVELKVLCKIHHKCVVELLGYASGDDNLYLVYDYVQSGSLNDHLHEPLLKGNQPLSWTARAHIALDAARGIEYIHDHTKARYVHRDIKTANILLDRELRGKIADFGLAKLVERSNDGDLIVTRLVGTPGYLPPEALSELQTTCKTDVFAFGVVLSELITGQRALVRDNQESGKMKSLISVMNAIFSENDSEASLESSIDGNLRGSYPKQEAYKMAETAWRCMSADAANRPEMREIVMILDQILMSSVEWEASLGGNSQTRIREIRIPYTLGQTYHQYLSRNLTINLECN